MKTAYCNGQVYTGELLLRQAFLVEDGRFLKVGSNREVLAFLSDSDARIDLQGRFVCAGFNDSHMHLLGFGNVLRMAQLARHTGSLAEMLDYLRDTLAGKELPDGQWLLGRGWNQDFFSDVHRMPDRHDLDSVSMEFPIMLTRACGHCCVVNSKALALAGIGPDTVSPEGGAIGLADGQPDGRLYDNAIELVQRVLPVPGRREIREMLRAACREVNRRGITSVQTDDDLTLPGVSWETVHDIYREMATNGELTVRVNEQVQFPKLDDLRRFIEAGNRTGKGDNLFRIGPVKILGDGSLGSRTAYLSRPYADAPDTKGFPLLSEECLNAIIGYAHEQGMQVAVHAIGDACLDQVLDAIARAQAENPRDNHRHGIVHCQITRPDQLDRIRDLGLHVYAQSIFLDYDNHIVEKRVGRDLVSTSYSWKTLMDGGVSVSNGSDCPVELPDVMAGIQCAVTRKSLDGTGPYLPGQAFSVQEALDSFTWRGAEASFEESVKGRIAPGYLADFAVLSGNPFERDPNRLHQIKVDACYLGGKCVFTKKSE
ncbi:MAG: amidohydrolase [Clostridia bacterium]|nr:amidohydrolase [Clostridia bacterium]